MNLMHRWKKMMKKMMGRMKMMMTRVTVMMRYSVLLLTFTQYSYTDLDYLSLCLLKLIREKFNLI